MSDTSIKTNVFSTGFTKNYSESLGINPGAFTMGPFASGNNNQSRTYYYYNGSGGLVRQFTWRSGAPTGSGGDTVETTLQPAPRTTATNGQFVTSPVTWQIGAFTVIRGF